MLANSSEGANQTLDDEDKVQTEHDYSQWPVKKKKFTSSSDVLKLCVTQMV